MHVVKTKKLSLVLLGFLILVGLLGGVVFGPKVFADDPPIGGGCSGYDTTNLTSPFSSTPNMCLGDAGVRWYYQFAVKLPSAISNVSISAKAGDTNISFVKQSDTLYVSEAGSNYSGMGYGAATPDQVLMTGTVPCAQAEATNKVQITARGNGKTQLIDINLCNYNKRSEQTLIYVSADSLVGDNGTTSEFGWIEGSLGILREGAAANNPIRLGTLEKAGIVSIELSGQMTESGDSGSNWFSLGDGSLRIGNLEEGTYSLAINYNDCRIAQRDGWMPEFTTCDLTMEFRNIYVKAGSGTTITYGDGKTQYYDAEGNIVDPSEEESSIETTSSCQVDGGVGWIVCPILNFMFGMADGAFSIIANFLDVRPEILNTSSGTYTAWSAFRNIANVLFVIVFLIIIFSQLTGTGISNYGVKKTLPRLVVTVILVNISFFVCQLAVDITQIIGFSIKDFLNSIEVGVSDTSYMENPWSRVGGEILAGVGGVLVGAGIVVAVALSVSVPVLLAFLFAVLMTVVILIGRQAAIVILIVLSPLAFVAFLLPNTEQWFKKWYKMFFGLLMVFPIIGLLYGGGMLTSKILKLAADSAGGGDAFWLGLMAIGVAGVPLIMTPSLLKNSLSATGKVGAKISGWGGKAQGQIGKTAMKSSRLGGTYRHMQGQTALRRQKALGGVATGSKKNPLRWASHIGAAGNKLTNKIVPGGDRYADKAAQLQKEEFDKEVSAAEAQQENMTFDQRNSIADTGRYVDSSGKTVTANNAQKTAAVKFIMANGNTDHRRNLIQKSASLSQEERKVVVSGLMAKGDQGIYGAAIGDAILGGTVNETTLRQATVRTIEERKIKPSALARDIGTVNYVNSVTASTEGSSISSGSLSSLSDTAREALGSADLMKDAPGELRDGLGRLANLIGVGGGTPPPTTPPPTPPTP